MAITRAQQVRQMLEDGGMLVQPSMTGKRPGYRGPGGYQGGRSSRSSGPAGGASSGGNYGGNQNTGGGGGGNQNTGGGGGNRRESYITNYSSKGIVKGGGKKVGEDKDGSPIFEDSKPSREVRDRQKAKYNQQFLSRGLMPPTGSRPLSFTDSMKKKRNQQILNFINRNMLTKYNRFTNPPTSMLSKTGYPNYGIPNIYGIVEDNLEAFGDLRDILKTGNRIPVGKSKTSVELNPIPDLDVDSIRELAAAQSKFGSLTGYQADQLEDLRQDIKNRDELVNEGMTQERFEELYPGPPKPKDDDPKETDPCLGPNPPAYCFVNQDDNKDDTTDPRTNFYGLSPRIAGSLFDFSGLADGGRVAAMDGGIMDVAREEMFLGGIAKGIKKGLKSVTRGIKKVVKSPIGKAALLGAVGYGLGGGTFFGKMLPGVTRGGQGFGGFGGLSSIFGNVGDMIGGKGLGDAFAKFGGNKALTGILGASILPLLFGKKEEDEFDIDAYYAANRLNRNAQLYNRIAGSQFSFAEGGEVEPVAKKTMPLLDMGGQEMDLRAEGGFVPIGRMEKADDVPARLSKNEFVFTAEAVRNAGEGDVDKGAEVMYNMMKNLESGGEVSEESQGLEGAREMFKTSQRLGEVI
jgi:hypothetical protein